MSTGTRQTSFGLILIFVAIAFLLITPVVAEAVNTKNKNTHEQIKGEIKEIDKNYYSNITKIDNSTLTVNLFFNKTSFESKSKTLNLSEEKIYSLNSENITVSYEANVSTTEFFMKYEFSRFINIPDTSEILIKNIPVILLILGVFTFIGGVISITWNKNL